jgi:hypothetical protein
VKKWIIVAALFTAVCAVHIYLVITKGYHPPPKKIMTPSEFASGEAIGESLALRFWQEMREEQVTLLGLSPDLSIGEYVWEQYLRTTLERGVTFDRYFVEGEDFFVNGPKLEPLDWEEVRKAVASKQRVFVYYAQVSRTPAEVIEEFKGGVIFFQGAFFVRKSSEEKMPQQCDQSKNVEMRESPMLGCNVLETSRRYYRKNLDHKKLWAMVEKPKGIKHVLYVHEPEKE